MAKAETLLTIDIGGDSLKFAEFAFDEAGSLELIDFAFVEYGLDFEDDQERFQAIKAAISNTFSEHNFKSRNVRISVSVQSQSAFIRLVKLPPIAEDNEERIQQIVEYEARQAVPFPIEEIVWDYQLIHAGPGAESEEDSAPETPESGASEGDGERHEEPAFSLSDHQELEAMFVVIKNELVTEISELIERYGKYIETIEVAPTATYNAARAGGVGANGCTMILNIGGSCSSLTFIDGNRVFIRPIPIAGHSITKQISKEFGIPFADAEELKRRHGFVALGGAYEEPDSEVAATVSKIARSIMIRLHGEINRSINAYRSQHGGNRPKMLYLAGGASIMLYTPRFFNEKLRLPVEYLDAFKVINVSEVVDREALLGVAHMYSESIGMALREITTCPMEISLIPHNLRKLRAFNAKKPFFYASAVSIILCMLVNLFGFRERLKFDKARVDVAKGKIEKTKVLFDRVTGANQKLKGVIREYQRAEKYLAERHAWIKVLDELQKAIPDQVWLTTIEAGDEGATTVTTRPSGAMSKYNRPSASPAAASAVSGEVRWLRITGHALVLDQSVLIDDVIRENLKKSEVFSSKQGEIRFLDSSGGKGNDNVTGFEMRVKLKNPIKI